MSKAQVTRRKRGSILLLALFFMFTLFLLAVAFFKLLPTELQSAARSSRDVKAHYVADGGVKNAASWLKGQVGTITQDDLDDNYNDTYDSGTPIVLDGHWSYTCRIDVNPTGSGLYDIVCQAYYHGRPIREVRCSVQQDTFAKYAMFIDRWSSGNSNASQDLVFTLGDAAIQGPFHTNDFFNLKAPSSSYWTTPGLPWANGPKTRLTYSRTLPESQNTLGAGIGDGNRYYGGNYMGSDPGMIPFDKDDGAPDSSRYGRMIDGGREKLNQVSHINLPDNVANLKAKAWNNDETTTGQNSAPAGINVNTDLGPNAIGGTVSGGVYISGDANKLQFEIDQKNQAIRVRGKEDYYRKWESNIVMIDDVDCVPNGTYSQYELHHQVPCDLWGIVDYILPDGSNGLSSPQPVYGWIPDGTTCPESYSPPQYQQYENCTNTTICTACVPQDQGGWVEVPEGTPGAQHRTRTNSQDEFVIEVTEGYSIPAGEFVDGAVTSGAMAVPTDKTIVKLYNDIESRYEWSVLDGPINGVIYVDGNVYNMKGTVKGSKYTNDKGIDDYHGKLVATRLDRDTTIVDDILQYYDGTAPGNDPALEDPDHPMSLKRGESSPNSKHIFGLITEDLTIDTPNKPSTHFSPTGSNGDGDLALYGIYMAGRTLTDSHGDPQLDSQGRPKVRGGFGVAGNDQNNNDGLGLIRLFGGIIQANGKKTYTNHGSNQDGYAMELNYDSIAAENLENFPQTSEYSIVRYVEHYVGG